MLKILMNFIERFNNKEYRNIKHYKKDIKIKIYKKYSKYYINQNHINLCTNIKIIQKVKENN